jgi:hypothetical protein
MIYLFIIIFLHVHTKEGGEIFELMNDLRFKRCDPQPIELSFGRERNMIIFNYEEKQL